MITRRIAEQIRSQDWVAISIELVVVIFGVYLGLQANEWNESRKGAIEEVEYLKRILNDVNETIRISSASISLIEGSIQNTGFALDVIDSGTIEEDVAEEFGEALFFATRTSQVRHSSATLNELISSGKLGLIQNTELRNSLSDLAMWPEQMRLIVQKPEEQKSELTSEKFGFYTARQYSDGTLNIDYDADWILENPRVYQVLANMQATANTTLQFHREFLQRYKDIKGSIEEELTLK